MLPKPNRPHVYYLIDYPTALNDNGNPLEFVIDNPKVVEFFDANFKHSEFTPTQFDWQLTQLLRNFRKDYFPQEAHNYIRIPHWSPAACSQLAEFHTELHQLTHFQHQGLKLIAKPLND